MTINSTVDIIRASRFLENHIDLSKLKPELCILYLTIIYKASRDSEKPVPLPYWFYGLPEYETYLRFFSRFNLIFKNGNRMITSEEFHNFSEDYEINDPEILGIIEASVSDIPELSNYFRAA